MTETFITEVTISFFNSYLRKSSDQLRRYLVATGKKLVRKRPKYKRSLTGHFIDSGPDLLELND